MLNQYTPPFSGSAVSQVLNVFKNELTKTLRLFKALLPLRSYNLLNELTKAPPFSSSAVSLVLY